MKRRRLSGLGTIERSHGKRRSLGHRWMAEIAGLGTAFPLTLTPDLFLTTISDPAYGDFLLLLLLILRLSSLELSK